MCGWTSKRYRKGGDVLVAGWYLESDGYAGPQVSKQHAVLSVLAGPRVCFLKDLGSRNGTVLFLGEAQARLPLTDGDRVQVCMCCDRSSTLHRYSDPPRCVSPAGGGHR